MPRMESDAFAAGYQAALDDFANFARANFAPGPQRRHIDGWIERKRGEYGSEFTQTIIGSGTGPQDGLRRGTDS